MATNIPPHSLDELIDGLLLLLENKEATLEEVMEFIKGPDFPTGGIIFGKKGIIEAYRTGRGRVKLRAKTHIEKKAKQRCDRHRRAALSDKQSKAHRADR